MANAKPKTKTKLISKKPIVLVLCFIVLFLALLAGYKLYAHHQQQTKQFKIDQANFKQAETDMAAAYSAIVQSVGQPYETHLDKSCSHVSLKFKKGPLRCGVTYNFTYTNEEITTAANQSLRVRESASKTVTMHETPQPIAGLADPNKSYSQSIEGIKGMVCSLDYNLIAEDLYIAQINADTPFKKSSNSKYVSEYGLTCGNGAAGLIYPLEDNLHN